MKAHIAAAAPRAYHYGVKQADRQGLERVLEQLNISAKVIAPGQITQRVDRLDEPAPQGPFSGPAQSLLLLDGVDGELLQTLLAALKKEGVQVDYKAVVTPHNRQWTVVELLEELKRERQAIREAQKS